MIFSAAILQLAVPAIQGQTATIVSHNVISAQPPDSIHFEKAIGNFTSTSYPSFFLGTDSNGYVFDTRNLSLNLTWKRCGHGISHIDKVFPKNATSWERASLVRERLKGGRCKLLPSLTSHC